MAQMTFEQKRDAAIEIMAKAGIARSSYAPLLWRQAWHVGIPLRPPHFLPFWLLAASTALPTSLVWGVAMRLTVWRIQAMPDELAIAACDLAEIIGSAIALNLLFRIPLLIGICITGLDV